MSSFILELPPLKERSEDIPGLVRFYLREFNEKYQCSKTISPNAIRYLLKYPFPGNIRELKSIIENAVVMSEVNRIDDFIKLSTINERTTPVAHLPPADDDDEFMLTARLENLERHILQNARDRFRTTREIAARIGISQPSVVRKLKKYKIE